MLNTKLKGSISNVPVETNHIANTLPQGADNNGITNVSWYIEHMFILRLFHQI